MNLTNKNRFKLKHETKVLRLKKSIELNAIRKNFDPFSVKKVSFLNRAVYFVAKE